MLDEVVALRRIIVGEAWQWVPVAGGDQHVEIVFPAWTDIAHGIGVREVMDEGEYGRVPRLLERELYRQQVSEGLEGKPEAMAKARLILRDLLGDVQLKPSADGSLWAEYQMRPAVLLQAAGSTGRGDRI